MKRTGPPRSDPEKVADWRRRSQARAREKAQAAQPSAPTPKPRPSPRARREAAARSDWRCVVCAVDLRRARPGKRHLHHVLPARSFPALATRADNLVLVCVGCHFSHEHGGVSRRPIPRAALPDVVLALADAEGLGWFIDRTYPSVDWRVPTPVSLPRRRSGSDRPW